MEDTVAGGINFKEAMRRRLPLAVMVLSALLLITVAAALGLPSVYQSRAIILIEQQEIPQDLVRSMVTSFADQRIQVISQRVLTNANLTSIIEKYSLYADDRRDTPLERIIETMRKDISIAPISADVVDPKQGRAVQATIAFNLSFENESPERAQRVANELVSLFLNENLKQRQETSSQTLSFLSEEQERLNKQIGELEQRMADFKAKNVGQLPELQQLNIEMMNRTEADIRQLDSQLGSLEQQRVYLESELAQQQPNSTLFSETGERILGPADRLKVLDTQFAQLSARYGPRHPDVLALRKEMDSLRAQAGGSNSGSELALRLGKARTDLAAARQKYSAEHPDLKRLTREVASLEKELAAANAAPPPPVARHADADNPAYIQLKARLEATDADIRSYRAQRAALAAKIAGLEERLTKAPEVEREYRTLTRDYEVAQLKYQEVTAKRQEAELASNLESEQQGERFTLIEPPLIPEEPSKPNRAAIGLLGGVLALVGGFGSGALAESVDTRVYGRSGVVRILGVPPLAVIPNIDSASSIRRRRRNWLMLAAAFLLMLVIAAIVVHLAYRPLDIVFFQLLRKLGL